MSFLEGVEGTRFPLLPQEILVRAGARFGLGARARGRPPEVGVVLRAFSELPPGSLRPLPAPSCPRPRAVYPCGLISSGSRALEQLCLQTSRGRAGVRPSPAGARPPQAFGGVPGPGRGGPLEAVPAGASTWTRAGLLLKARAAQAERTARPLRHPEMVGRKMGAIAEGEEREKCWCPLPCSSCPGGVTH